MSGRLKIIAAVLVGIAAASTTGCVPKDKFDKLYSAWQRSQERLQKAETDLEDIKAQNQQLGEELATCQASLALQNKIVDNLKTANAKWRDDFAELNEKYKKAAGRDVTVIGPKIDILPIKVDTALRALVKENPDLMEYLPKYGMIKLKADLTFDKGSVIIKPAATAALGKLAEIVNTGEAKTFHVYVAGHTDDIPLVNRATISAHGSNWGLSLHRAGAVVKVLALGGVTQRRLGALGFSKYHPVAPNAPGNKGNPLNRRVEIWIVPTDRFLTASGVVQPEK